MIEPSWVTLERIAALVERALTPGAIVRHNVRLPVIGKLRTRQCDVVITFGEQQRQSIAIVEVQKRKSKPDINTFHGWVKKMQEVGAQQLFCVSAVGYPRSIIDEVATRIGPTVKLLTLSKLEAANQTGGIFLLPFHTHVTPTYQIVDIGTFSVHGSPPPTLGSLNSADKRFSTDGLEPDLSLDDIICGSLNALENDHVAHPPPWEDKVVTDLVLGDAAPSLWLHFDDKALRIVKWTIRVELTFKRETVCMPAENFTYEQQSANGTLAWIGRATLRVECVERDICIVFKPDAEGYLSVVAGDLRDPGQLGTSGDASAFASLQQSRP